ncbi:putative alcohol dehydrogenase [Aspergillus heteromorphus CBS 117.55]|uniref:Putative alcohol dehydrogenase n=1 Tax=Aspergillus heteromorphus CBS 117.55 TaxID=1448321 RepID=A0A317WE92_9EURO|nr:putative alcohol dehydrogenase [Aspergillus heteromorphus CBS 117.55]PWY83567.1 putative alcohol dehydrogenase [Aspergillus heteromorphus CBS 117.55]
MAAPFSLPTTHRALVLDKIGEPLRVETRPTPQVSPGTAVAKILVAGLLSYSREIYNGTRKYNLPTPCVPGNAAIGRIVAVGADATRFNPGDLVLIDIFIRGRDNPSIGALSGVHDGHTEASKRMMHSEWRDSTYAEYAKMPLENCFPLNEKRLLGDPSDGGLGYTVEDLLYMLPQIVPFGGLRAIGLDVCDRVIISPATGAFGSAAVQVALSMGSSVIAMGRNKETLEAVRGFFASQFGEDRIQAVPITNDVQQEVESLAKFGPADVFFDISPPQAAGSTHVKSAILSLRHSGRVCLMGGQREDVGIPLVNVMRNDLTIKGKWMYERGDVARVIQMVESGVLKLGKDAGSRTVGRFPLENWKEAFDLAAEHAGPGERVVFTP